MENDKGQQHQSLFIRPGAGDDQGGDSPSDALASFADDPDDTPGGGGPPDQTDQPGWGSGGIGD